MEIGTLLDRVPPQNLDAEQSTLGSMMIDRAALDKGVDILRPDDFYREAHQTIFDALVSLAERSEPVDIVTAQEELRSRGKLEDVGGTEYLMALIDSVPTAANVEYYARIVEEKAILRRLIDTCTQIMSLSHGAVDDVAALVDQCERMIFQVSQKRMGEFFTPLSILAHQGFEKIEEHYKDKSLVSGLSTGFHALDVITSGFQTSDFIIIAARPSMGKTALCLDIARHAAMNEKKPVALFSLEMSKEQLALRLICSESKIDSHRLRTGYIRDKEWTMLSQGVGRLYSAPIFIDDSTEINTLQMRAKCRRLKAEQGLGLVVVDYLQLMQSHRRVENRNQEISEISRGLKSLGRELEVPVVACSQLSRAVEKREDRKPVLSDLRESGAIEAEADLVAFIHRPAYYQHKELADDHDLEREIVGDEKQAQGRTDAEETEIIIAKHRNGPTGSIRLTFLPKFACFASIEEHRTDEE